MLERKLYTPCVNGALTEGWGLYNVSDLAPGKKPADILGVAKDGRAVLLELKVVEGEGPKTFQKLPWKQFAPHQKNWLTFYAMREAYALAGIYYEFTNELVIYRLKDPFMEEALTHEMHFQKMRYHPAHNLYTGWTHLLYKEAELII